MSDSFDRSAPPSQHPEVDQRERPRSTNVDQLTELDLLRQIVSEKNHTLDSLSSEMGGTDRSYIRKVLAGEKPMPEGFTDRLPDDVQAEWHARCAKRLGRHHVVPVLEGEAAVEAFIAGAVGMLARPKLPARADRMASASLPVTSRKVVAR